MENILTKELKEKLNGLEDKSLADKKEILLELYNQCIDTEEDGGTEGIILFFKFESSTVTVWSSAEYGGIIFNPDNSDFIDFCRHIYGIEVEEFGKEKIDLKNVRYVNLTPHDIVVESKELGDFTIPKQKDTPVCRIENKMVEVQAGLWQNHFGEVENLPDPQENTIYIVSLPVLMAINFREDVVAPNTGMAKRENGQIVSVPGFVMGHK